MQNLKERFRSLDGGRIGTLQSCVRTNDLELVGDGTHLTYFEMIGNFSFGNNDYQRSVEMWSSILSDLGLSKDCIIHCHPSDMDIKGPMWKGFPVIPDEECLWTDGDVGGTCCEVYWKGVEIGNLVNPLGHSTDVGFGYERLLMAVEGKDRVDETSVFRSDLSHVARDHVRTIESFWQNGIEPGNKGRNYVCRRLIRRILPLSGGYVWDEWLDKEAQMRLECMSRGRKLLKRHKDKPPQWWWETCGLTPEDVASLHSIE